MFKIRKNDRKLIAVGGAIAGIAGIGYLLSRKGNGTGLSAKVGSLAVKQIGSALTVRATITNTGNTVAEFGLGCSIEDAALGIWNLGGGQMVRDPAGWLDLESSMAPGESRTHQWAVTIPSGIAPGPARVIVKAKAPRLDIPEVVYDSTGWVPNLLSIITTISAKISNLNMF